MHLKQIKTILSGILHLYAMVFVWTLPFLFLCVIATSNLPLAAEACFALAAASSAFAAFFTNRLLAEALVDYSRR